MCRRPQVLLLLGVVLATACGRYKVPYVPDELAPKGVQDLKVIGEKDGVLFTWYAPEIDRRGKELKSLEGYRIQRKELLRRGDETNPDVKFEDVGFVPDTHIELRDELRKKARAEGKIGRTVQAPPESTTFAFKDISTKDGGKYLYQVIPENQGGVEGVVPKFTKVLFRGEQSEITTLNSFEIETPSAVTAKESSAM
jgi:hypothetical protein